MAMDYAEYERKCDEVRKVNAGYLDIFEHDLQGLAPRTIEKHLNNVEFYLNEFLLYYDILTMQQGTSQIGWYLGDYFIRKCMWSTPGTIKTTAASIKKFYKSMLTHGLIEQRQFDMLSDEIKDNMKDWQADCARYNNPDEEYYLWD